MKYNFSDIVIIVIKRYWWVNTPKYFELFEQKIPTFYGEYLIPFLNRSIISFNFVALKVCKVLSASVLIWLTCGMWFTSTQSHYYVTIKKTTELSPRFVQVVQVMSEKPLEIATRISKKILKYQKFF